MDDIIVQHSDTQGTPFGYGSYGSRTGVGRRHGGGQGRRQDPREGPRATPRTCSRRRPTTSRSTGAEYRVKGSPDKKKTLQEIAFALDLGFSLPDGMEPYLDETVYHDTPNCTWPFGTHIARRRDRRGDRRGRPQALRRGRRRRQEDQPDDRRRPAPRRHRPGRRPGALGGRGLRRRRSAAVGHDARLRPAAGVVAADTSSSTRRSPRRRSTRSGVKGVGEAGAIASTAAVANAVIDALTPFGIRHLDMPLTRAEGVARDARAKEAQA